MNIPDSSSDAAPSLDRVPVDQRLIDSLNEKLIPVNEAINNLQCPELYAGGFDDIFVSWEAVSPEGDVLAGKTEDEFYEHVRTKAVEIWKRLYGMVNELRSTDHKEEANSFADALLECERFLDQYGISTVTLSDDEVPDAPKWRVLNAETRNVLRPALIDPGNENAVVAQGYIGELRDFMGLDSDDVDAGIPRQSSVFDDFVPVSDSTESAEIPVSTTPIVEWNASRVVETPKATPATTKMSTLKKLTVALGLTLAGGGVGYLIGNNGKPDTQPDNTPTPANVQPAVPQQNVNVELPRHTLQLGEDLSVDIIEDPSTPGLVQLNNPKGMSGILYFVPNSDRPLDKEYVAAFEPATHTLTIKQIAGKKNVTMQARFFTFDKDGRKKTIDGPQAQ